MGFQKEVISSSQNSYFKLIRSLRQKDGRNETGFFTVEGKKFTKDIPTNWDVECFGISESYFEKEDVSQLKDRAEIKIFSDEIFPKLCDTINPQEILAVVKQKKLSLTDLSIGETSHFVMLENCNDPGNLGGVIRTACAAGFDGVITSLGSCDLYNQKTVRATAGTIFHIPVIEGADLNEVCSFLKNHGMSVYAACLNADKSAYECDFKKSSAFLIGNEASGLTEEIIHMADCTINLPIIGNAESLNAAVACGILIYETLRQLKIER